MGWDICIAVMLDRPPEEVFLPGLRHDPARAVQYVNAIYGGKEYADRGTTTLDLYPGQGLIYVGAYDGAAVISAEILIQPEIVHRMFAVLPGSLCSVMWANSDNRSVLFRLYRDGGQVRQVLLLDTAEGGVSGESGDRLPEEAPFWEHAPPPINGEVTPLPFDPEEFALEMARAYAFGQRPDDPGSGLNVRALPAQQFSFQKPMKRLAMSLRRWGLASGA